MFQSGSFIRLRELKCDEPPTRPLDRKWSMRKIVGWGSHSRRISSGAGRGEVDAEGLLDRHRVGGAEPGPGQGLQHRMEGPAAASGRRACPGRPPPISAPEVPGLGDDADRKSASPHGVAGRCRDRGMLFRRWRCAGWKSLVHQSMLQVLYDLQPRRQLACPRQSGPWLASAAGGSGRRRHRRGRGRWIIGCARFGVGPAKRRRGGRVLRSPPAGSGRSRRPAAGWRAARSPPRRW